MTTNWIGWILSGIVLLLLFLVGAILKNAVLLLITGERSQGVVVGMDTSSTSLQSPIVEFVTSTGERVRVKSRTSSPSPSTRVGDAVTVVYNPSQPRDAQFLLWREFIPVVFILGFTGFVLLMWMSFVLISGEPANGDPFGFIPAVISHFRLNPFRFPVLFMLLLVIPLCGLATYVLSKKVLDLRSNGIKAVGHVIGSQRVSSRLSDGSSASGVFPMIEYKDASGTAYTIRGSTAKPLSRLKTGDVVEVIYLARNPNKGVLNTWSELWLGPLIFGLFTLAFLVALGLVLSSGTIGSSTSDPRREVKLKISGVPAVATVIEAKPDTRILHFRIDKDPRTPTADLHGFEAAEQTLHDWKPSGAEAGLKRGDKFRAYVDLESLKPGKSLRFYIDFSDRIGFNPNVQSMEEEFEEDESL